MVTTPEGERRAKSVTMLPSVSPDEPRALREGKVAANTMPPPAARLAVRKPRRDRTVCGGWLSR